MPVPSLLAVFAHPDDESLTAGGTLARHAAAGARTAVVTATWAADTPRAAELADALHILGAGKPRMLGYADSRVPRSAPGRPRLCDAPLDEAVGALVAQIRDFRPEIVVTHDAYGGLSGHEDHVHTHRVTLLAVHAAASNASTRTRVSPGSRAPCTCPRTRTPPSGRGADTWPPWARRCARSRTAASRRPSTSHRGWHRSSPPCSRTGRRWNGEPPRA